METRSEILKKPEYKKQILEDIKTVKNSNKPKLLAKLLAMNAISDNKSQDEIVKLFDISRRTLNYCSKLYVECGLEGLIGKRMGRVSLFNEDIKLYLKDLITKNPLDLNYECPLWTGHMIRNQLVKDLNISICYETVLTWLKQSDIRQIRPKKS